MKRSEDMQERMGRI